MFISTRTPRAKVPLRAKQGTLPGDGDPDTPARRCSRSAREGTAGWQSSIDGGKTLVPWPPTPTTKTTITGLPALTECLFRACVL